MCILDSRPQTVRFLKVNVIYTAFTNASHVGFDQLSIDVKSIVMRHMRALRTFLCVCKLVN